MRTRARASPARSCSLTLAPWLTNFLPLPPIRAMVSTRSAAAPRPLSGRRPAARRSARHVTARFTAWAKCREKGPAAQAHRATARALPADPARRASRKMRDRCPPPSDDSLPRLLAQDCANSVAAATNGGKRARSGVHNDSRWRLCRSWASRNAPICHRRSTAVWNSSSPTSAQSLPFIAR